MRHPVALRRLGPSALMSWEWVKGMDHNADFDVGIIGGGPAGAALAGYLGKGDNFDRAIAEFSVDYADQNERDYAAFTEAINAGRIPAHE